MKPHNSVLQTNSRPRELKGCGSSELFIFWRKSTCLSRVVIISPNRIVLSQVLSTNNYQLTRYATKVFIESDLNFLPFVSLHPSASSSPLCFHIAQHEVSPKWCVFSLERSMFKTTDVNNSSRDADEKPHRRFWSVIEAYPELHLHDVLRNARKCNNWPKLCSPEL